MLPKTRDKLLTQNKKSQNEKTIMVRTWHPALKYLSKVLQEKYHQYIEKDIYLKKAFPEKPIIAFLKRSPSETTLLEQISRKQMTKRDLK